MDAARARSRLRRRTARRPGARSCQLGERYELDVPRPARVSRPARPSSGSTSRPMRTGSSSGSAPATTSAATPTAASSACSPRGARPGAAVADGDRAAGDSRGAPATRRRTPSPPVRSSCGATARASRRRSCGRSCARSARHGSRPPRSRPRSSEGARILMAERGPWEAEIPLDELRALPFPKLVVSGGHHPAFDADLRRARAGACGGARRRRRRGHAVQRAPGFNERARGLPGAGANPAQRRRGARRRLRSRGRASAAAARVVELHDLEQVDDVERERERDERDPADGDRLPEMPLAALPEGDEPRRERGAARASRTTPTSSPRHAAARSRVEEAEVQVRLVGADTAARA